MIEYQDSTAFIAHKGRVSRARSRRIAGLFDQLRSLTESNASFESVAVVIGGIIREFGEALGIEEEEGKLDGWGYIDRIKELLDQSVAEYREGNTQEAEALAIEAYLDNYEFIETDIAQDDRELMLKIEVDMREELVDMIKAGRPAAEIESHVDQIKTDLETARAVVTPELPLAAVVIASVAAMILAGTLYTRRKGLVSF
jgi:high-affinity iron transporter